MQIHNKRLPQLLRYDDVLPGLLLTAWHQVPCWCVTSHEGTIPSAQTDWPSPWRCVSGIPYTSTRGGWPWKMPRHLNVTVTCSTRGFGTEGEAQAVASPPQSTDASNVVVGTAPSPPPGNTCRIPVEPLDLWWNCVSSARDFCTLLVLETAPMIVYRTSQLHPWTYVVLSYLPCNMLYTVQYVVYCYHISSQPSVSECGHA